MIFKKRGHRSMENDQHVTITSGEDSAIDKWRDLLAQEQRLFRRIMHRTMPKVLVCLLISGFLIIVARGENAIVCEYIFAAAIALGSLLAFQSGWSLYKLRQQMHLAKAVISSCEAIEHT
jgi:hypothetical protein